MRRTCALIGLTVLALGAAAGFASAQAKIGVINSQDVLEKSAEGKKAIARLQDTDKQNQNAISKLDDEIRQLQTKINTGRVTMTQEALLNASSELEKKNTDRKRKAEDAYSSMNELQQRLFTRLQDELVPIVELIAKEKGLDIVFDLQRSGAVYWSPAIDLTAEVIKRYDAVKATQK